MVVLGDIRRSLASRKSYDVRDEEGGPASVGFLLYAVYTPWGCLCSPWTMLATECARSIEAMACELWELLLGTHIVDTVDSVD